MVLKITSLSKFSLLLLLAVPALSRAQKAKQVFISNPSAISRPDELVVLKREQLEAKLGEIGKGQYISVTSGSKTPVVLQFDDLNRDGRWDEAAFLYSFKAGDKVPFSISIGNRLPGKAVARAHVRHRRKQQDDTFGPAMDRDSIPAGQPNTDFAKQKLPPFLTEGPAWENDKVGFRIYFDRRNTKDIWGKTTPKMVLDQVGVDPSVVYHHLDSWGMDILAVGKSLGAGSLALSVPIAGKKDTLIRLGGENMGPVFYEKLADGPVRALFRMHYPRWNALGDGKLIDLAEEVSIWGGQYFYESKITVHNAPAEAKLVTGIVNLNSKKSVPIAGSGVQGIYTFDNQSENKDKLGMAVLTPSLFCDGTGTTPNDNTEVKNTYYVGLKISPAAPSEYRFYSAWEKSDQRFSTESEFSAFLHQEALKYGQRLKLSWK